MRILFVLQLGATQCQKAVLDKVQVIFCGSDIRRRHRSAFTKTPSIIHEGMCLVSFSHVRETLECHPEQTASLETRHRLLVFLVPRSSASVSPSLRPFQALTYYHLGSCVCKCVRTESDSPATLPFIALDTLLTASHATPLTTNSNSIALQRVG